MTIMKYIAMIVSQNLLQPCFTVMTLICMKWLPMDAGITFLATNFTRKMQETSDFKYFVSFSCYETYIKVFTRIGPNSQKLKILFEFNFGQLGPFIQTNFTVSCGFDSVKVNLS